MDVGSIQRLTSKSQTSIRFYIIPREKGGWGVVKLSTTLHILYSFKVGLLEKLLHKQYIMSAVII